MDKEEEWKCRSHPFSRHRTGICPLCLRNRLVDLCPNCASLLPCLTCPVPYSSTSTHIVSTASLRNLIDNEPSFKRSTSLAISILRSTSRFSDHKSPASARRAKSILFSFFKTNDKSKKSGNEEMKTSIASDDDHVNMMMRRSRSVGRGWFFWSPIKAFQQTKTSKGVQERLPMHKG